MGSLEIKLTNYKNALQRLKQAAQEIAVRIVSCYLLEFELLLQALESGK